MDGPVANTAVQKSGRCGIEERQKESRVCCEGRKGGIAESGGGRCRTQTLYMENIQNSTSTGLVGDLDVQNSQNESFLYFAYGSNLLRERIMLKNPSVVFLTLAHILDYKLAFGSYQGKPSSTWHGSTATIIHSPGDEVWGIVWKMNTTDLCSLDSQEGVEAGIYVPIEINAQTQDGKVLKCRSYQMDNYVYGLPSPQYKKVICMGAKQNGLPADYQKKLEFIETNNYGGPVSVFEEIEAAFRTSKTMQ